MNEASDTIRKKKLVVGVRQQQRLRKFAAVQMLEEMIDPNTIIDTQPVIAIPELVDDPVQQHTPDINSIGENAFNFVDGARPDASEPYSFADTTEEDNFSSDADSYQAFDDDDGEEACELLSDMQSLREM
ncbi:hypothetical protein DAPPUDRAFT_321773 [Daphnia pulex]|uniref:Uncharacterized protein n=1 Tax=Daphnia pulex TaxID=6669 RepID=E9GTV5_DAPPU|nr:hypothetical protein DAPPUDRAFT_321773 [Daphnia pulex]|eukprot:EFX77141.1 hypothetical protein DAPPUDRAFT_321773 [Daphnia pulex]